MAGLRINEVIDCADGSRDGSAAGPEELGRDHLHRPVDASDALAVVAHAADGARHMRTVRVDRRIGGPIENGGVVVEEVPPVDVVDVAVAVVVDTVSGNLSRIGPDVGGQIGMRGLNALVDHADHDVGRSGVASTPRLSSTAAVGVRRGGGISLHAPEGAVGERGVVGGGEGLDDVVRLGELHSRIGLERHHGVGDGLTSRELHDLTDRAGDRDATHLCDALARTGGRLGGGAGAGLVGDDQSIRNVGLRYDGWGRRRRDVHSSGLSRCSNSADHGDRNDDERSNMTHRDGGSG